MFLVTRRLYPAMVLTWLVFGILGQAWLLPVPALLMLGFLLFRHHRILGAIGTAPLCSDGFAKHVLVDDLLRLAGLTLLSPLLFVAGSALVAA
jgi:hypothetical protein